MLGSSVVSDLEVVVAASYTNESGENIKVNSLCLLTHFSPRFQEVQKWDIGLKWVVGNFEDIYVLKERQRAL